ncbi:MAG TPA: endonuclease/exonuclease/phosphatase family protein [Actinomycetota bacterium]
MDLRVLVHNVKGFEAGPDEAAAAVAEHVPDIAMITEAGTRRRFQRYVRALEMEPAAPSLLPLARTVRNAVLVRPPWRIVRFHMHRFHASKRFYPRGALVAVVGRAGYRVHALSVHLGLAGEERRRHAEELTNLTAGLQGPVLVGGDFNEGPRSPAVRWVAERYWDSWERGGDRDASGSTFPAVDPTSRIDYLFVSEHLRVDGAWVLSDEVARASSDHLPLVVDVALD